ncbi:MAG: bL17 family ribosomal protein [bacterium]|nr:bL17 family ribosomal protein [bacterium]
MRHRKRYKKLRRYTEHRLSMLRNLMKNVITSPRLEIVTTLARAKSLSNFGSKLLTYSRKAAKIKALINNAPEDKKEKLKTELVNLSRKIYSYLGDRKLVKSSIDLGSILNSKNKEKGGYFSIYRVGFRRGDSAPQAIIRIET